MAGETNNTITKTIQTGIKSFNKTDITKYALMLGGLNVANDALAQYDPLKTGFGRIFMITKPLFLDKIIHDKLTIFKHIIEYGNTSISGITDTDVDFNSMTGGYVGKSMEIPSVAKDNTNQLTINVYEFSGQPVREVIHTWINGSMDLMSGLTHYYGHAGYSDPDSTTATDKIVPCQANQTAEFIYVNTDQTGTKVEYACMFANCFPRSIKNDQFNYESGTHDLVQYSIEFSATKYESAAINDIAQKLINRYQVLMNSIDFYPGKNASNAVDAQLFPGFKYDPKSGTLKDKEKPNVSNQGEIVGVNASASAKG